MVRSSQAHVSKDRRSASCPTPTGFHAYFDKVQFWVRTPLDQRTLDRLRSECGRGGVYVQNQPARFNALYRQRVELRQPLDQALRWLATRDDALINRAEVTIDLVFDCLADRDDAWGFLHRHIVRRRHGKKQEIRIVREADAQNDTIGTRYDAGSSASNKIVFYAEGHSRLTGELNCLHLEWRLKGLKAVRAAGIKLGRDLLEFDHRAFWRRRLCLYDVDRRRLGRMVRNKARSEKRRTSEIHPSGTGLDGRTGEVLVRAYDTVQELIDNMRAHIKVSRALVPISGEYLLPR